MFDLFISYSSYDRPWAKRLYDDVHYNFPTINIFWDRDPAAIPPAANWAQVLENEAKAAKHLVVIWSRKAEERPTQLAAEIESRDIALDRTPQYPALHTARHSWGRRKVRRSG